MHPRHNYGRNLCTALNSRYKLQEIVLIFLFLILTIFFLLLFNIKSHDGVICVKDFVLQCN